MSFLMIGQIIISLLLIIVIMLQSEGSGLSSVLGGAQFYGTRRGVEKVVFTSTVILAGLFILSALIAYFN